MDGVNQPPPWANGAADLPPGSGGRGGGMGPGPLDRGGPEERMVPLGAGRGVGDPGRGGGGRGGRAGRGGVHGPERFFGPPPDGEGVYGRGGRGAGGDFRADGGRGGGGRGRGGGRGGGRPPFPPGGGIGEPGLSDEGFGPPGEGVSAPPFYPLSSLFGGKCLFPLFSSVNPINDMFLDQLTLAFVVAELVDHFDACAANRR